MESMSEEYPFFTRSFFISCGSYGVPGYPDAGFEKTYFNDMECTGTPLDIPEIVVPKATSSQQVKDAAFTYNNSYTNNGRVSIIHLPRLVAQPRTKLSRGGTYVVIHLQQEWATPSSDIQILIAAG